MQSIKNVKCIAKNILPVAYNLINTITRKVV